MAEMADLIGSGAGASGLAGASAGANATTPTATGSGSGFSWDKALMGAGTGVQVGSALSKGSALKSAYDAKANDYLLNASDARSSGAMSGQEQRFRMENILSKQRSLAAASGAGATNPTVLDIMGDTVQRGEFLSRDEVAKGENTARGFEDRAAAARFAGQNAQTGSILDAVTAGLKGYGAYKKSYG